MKRVFLTLAALAAIGMSACSGGASPNRPEINNPNTDSGGSVSDAAVDSGNFSDAAVKDGPHLDVDNPDQSLEACLRVEAFIDLGGPASREYFLQNHPEVVRNYEELMDRGVFDFSFRHYPMTPNDLLAAEVAECVRNQGENLFLDYLTRLFENQDNWAALGNPTDVADILKEYGRSLGLNYRLFISCVDERETREAVAVDYTYADTRMLEMSKKGVLRGTPTFFVNDTIPFIEGMPLQGAVGYETLSRVFDPLLEECGLKTGQEG